MNALRGFVVLGGVLGWAACGGDDGAGGTVDSTAETSAEATASPETATGDDGEGETTAASDDGDASPPGPDNETEWDWTLGGQTVTDYEANRDSDVTWSADSGVSLRLESIRNDTVGAAGFFTARPADELAGRRVRFSARVRAESVVEYGALRLATSVGEVAHRVASTHVEAPIRGTADWSELSLVLDVDPAADTITLSLLLVGAGTLWLDDARLEAVAAEGPDDDLRLSEPQALDAEGAVDALGIPAGWLATGSEFYLYELRQDDVVVHGGEASFMMRSAMALEGEFAASVQMLHTDAYRGKRMRLGAWVKTDEVAGWTGVWMRVDGYSGTLRFDNMGQRPIVGTTEWAEHSVVLDVPDSAIGISIGILQSGSGTTWFDDLTFEEVDESVPETGF